MSEQKIRLVCGGCHTVNQFPTERLNDQPLCAKCKQPLFSGKPISVNTEQLKRHIHHSGLPVLVDFWAPWCGPCVSFAPTYESFASAAGNQIRTLKIDTQANQNVGGLHNIRSIPTLALFMSGQEVSRVSGALSLPQLQQWVVEQLNQR